jgi:hypothetical protein
MKIGAGSDKGVASGEGQKMTENLAQTGDVLTEEEADRLVDRYFHGYVDWYSKGSIRLERVASTCMWAGIVAGLLSTVIAGASSTLQAYIPSWSVWIVFFSAVTTMSNGLQARYGNSARAREQGSIRVNFAEQRLRVRLTHLPMSSAQRATEVEAALVEIRKVEGLYGGAPVTAHQDEPSAGAKGYGPSRRSKAVAAIA